MWSNRVQAVGSHLGSAFAASVLKGFLELRHPPGHEIANHYTYAIVSG
jgi:hypothetical protein